MAEEEQSFSRRVSRSRFMDELIFPNKDKPKKTFKLEQIGSMNPNQPEPESVDETGSFWKENYQKLVNYELCGKQPEPSSEMNSFKRLINVSPIIFPDSPFRMGWDFLILLLVIYYAFTVPLEVSFNANDEADPNSLKAVLDSLFTSIFVIDILLNFRTSYTDNGVFVTDATLIAIEYAKFWFLIDMVAILPFDKLASSDSEEGLNNLNVLLRLLRIFKLLRCFKLTRILKRYTEFLMFNPSFIRLVRLLVSILVIWHLIACLYWMVSSLENFGVTPYKLVLNGTEEDSFTIDSYNRDGGNLWVPPPELWCREISEVMCNETAFEDFEAVNGFNPFRGIQYCFDYGHCPATKNRQYLYSFFWAVMVTTGIGRDIMPVNALEHIFSAIMIILGCIGYAYVIGSVSSSLSNLDAEKAERKRKLESINQYLRQRNVPLSLQKRIRSYYDYMWSSHQSLNAREGILGDLHRTLWLELNISLNRKLVEKVPMFQMIKDSECVIDMIEKLSPKIFIPGEYIVLQGEFGSEMYIIVRGTVLVLVKEADGNLKEVASLSDGDVFGESSLLNRCRRNASIRAAIYCDTLVLSKVDFDQVLSKYPEFSASMHQVAAAKSSGWERIRALIRMARSVSLFGEPFDIEKVLLPQQSKLQEQSLKRASSRVLPGGPSSMFKRSSSSVRS